MAFMDNRFLKIYDNLTFYMTLQNYFRLLIIVYNPSKYVKQITMIKMCTLTHMYSKCEDMLLFTYIIFYTTFRILIIFLKIG